MTMRGLRWQFVLATLIAFSLAMIAFASCPLLTHDDANDEREFQNVCQQIANPTMQTATIGTLTVTSSTTLRGTSTNDNASAGNYGEYVSSVSVPNTPAPASNAFGDLVSIVLTAGDWDLTAVFHMAANGSTTNSSGNGIGISAHAGNDSTGLVEGDSEINSFGGTTAEIAGSIPSVRESISSTTTFYLKMTASYSGGPPQFRGRLSARRMR